MRPLRLLLPTLLCAVTGCAAPMLALSERETDAILSELDGQVERERAEARDAPGGEGEQDPEPAADVPDVMTLADALRLAAGGNRDLETGRESLVLSAVALRNARRDVGPRLSGSLSYLLAGTEDGEQTRSDSATLGAAYLLPTGAEVSVSGRADKDHGRGDLLRSEANASLTARVSQPLLRGFGRESAYESLTDAQREALYDVRGFELTRQDLALRVQREFYALVAQKRFVANRELTLENFEFLKRRSERLFEVDRVSEVDKFRAAREYLSAENDLIDTRQEYAARLDRFKILLGLPTRVAFDVADEIPTPRDVALTAGQAIQLALRNRLELMTVRDQVDDSERRVRIRERDLLPQLDLEAVRSRASETARRLGKVATDQDSYSVGLALELPLDRVRERGALRRARIELDRARRAQALQEDSVILEVRESFRNLRSAANSLTIQEQIVTSEEKNARVARMRFEEGEIGNRDLTDAIIGLADARDRFVREQVNLETARLQLLRDIGILVLTEDGTWVDE